MRKLRENEKNHHIRLAPRIEEKIPNLDHAVRKFNMKIFFLLKFNVLKILVSFRIIYKSTSVPMRAIPNLIKI